MDKKVIRTPIWDYQGDAVKINVTKRYGCFQGILIPIKQQLDAMVERYSRVLMVRIDLHVHEYSGANKKISTMLRRLKEWLTETYGMTDVGHIWVRELEKAKSQHYHLALMLNGHKLRHPSKLIAWIEQYWTNRNEPKPFTPRACYTMIKRGDPGTYGKAFYRLSYLAKERGKGYKDAAANNYSASRLKPRGRDNGRG